MNRTTKRALRDFNRGIVDCTFKGQLLYGKVQIVSYGASIKIQLVRHGADLKVQKVESG